MAADPVTFYFVFTFYLFIVMAPPSYDRHRL